MKLYYSPGACSLAPHVALREAGVDFEPVRIAIADKANQSPDYLRINPRARVPALQIGKEVYTEAPALLVFIASQAPEKALLPPPADPALARALEWLAWFSSSLHIAYAQLWRPERFLPAEADSADFTAHARTIIERMNGEVEQRLAGPWLLGERFSLADISSLPFYRWGQRIGLDMAAACPRWTEVIRGLLARPAVQAALDEEGLGAGEFIAPA